ncbi:MAG: cysteine--tRNA ligase [Actinomycetota bacterium]|nr:cysteine--tRNA ligase [Actinomycetota bacterium]
MLRLYDTATGRVEDLGLRRAGELSMYVCGATVYAEAHAGHGRFGLVWDVLRRYARWSGLSVRFVSNVTDIDDKIIARAAAESTSPAEVAATWEASWWESMDRLGVGRPDETPHATAYVERMVELVGSLLDSEKAYLGGDGVYFSTASVPDYGLLAPGPLEQLQAGARVEVSEEAGKRSPLDFALWKLAKPGEPSWPAPWGAGRPGWHTECVVMALDLLGDGFDLHGGGVDLAFPHHENERAQAEAAGRGFARHWAHSGMVVAAGGEKMSKSLGNTMSLAGLLGSHDPRAYRLLCLQCHYRRPLTVSPATLGAAGRAVEGLDAFGRDFAAAREVDPDAGVRARFAEAMDDDLDTPGAVAVLFDAMRQVRSAGDLGVAAAVIDAWEKGLGLPLAGEAEVPPEALARAAERDAARAAKDWSRADALRAELAAAGWLVEDTPAGTKLRPAR